MSAGKQVYFEDFKVGATDKFGEHKVSESEIIEFAEKYDPQPFHLDLEAGRQSIFGALCASGWHTCSLVMRMMVDHTLDRAASLGSPGVDEIQWVRPVLVGDTISVTAEVVETRILNSRPERGLVRWLTTVVNQHDEPVMIMRNKGFFLRRPVGKTAQ